MKKYNLSRIMKQAWKEAKEALTKNFDYFNKLAEKYCAERVNTYCVVNHWEKGGNDKYYFNIRRRNHRFQKSAGYWDEVAQKYVAPGKGGVVAD